MNIVNNQMLAAVHYIIICGSYERHRLNDRLCNFLGNELAKHNLGIIFGGSRPGVKIAESMNTTLSDLDRYDPFQIITVYRKKNNGDVLKTKRIGCNLFVGNDIHDIRDYLFSKSKILIVIGGALRTKEEVLLAQERGVNVIPVGSSGGTASNVWHQYNRSGKYSELSSFSQLNNKNAFVVANAIIDILKKLTQGD